MTEKTDNPLQGHRKRLRMEFLENRGASLKDRELLELLLTYVIPRVDVEPHARRLLAGFGTLENILSAEPARLMETEGIGENAAVFLSAAGAVMKRALVEHYLQEKGKKKLKSAEEAAAFALALSMNEHEEKLSGIFLDASGNVTGVSVLASGGIAWVDASPRLVMEKALIHKAAGVILVHNHPGGDPNPSEEDTEAAEMLDKAGNDLRLPVVDQLIAGKAAVYSFRYDKVFAFEGVETCRAFTLEEWKRQS